MVGGVHDQKQGVKMAEHELAFDGNRVATKRGVPVYRSIQAFLRQTV